MEEKNNSFAKFSESLSSIADSLSSSVKQQEATLDKTISSLKETVETNYINQNQQISAFFSAQNTLLADAFDTLNTLIADSSNEGIAKAIDKQTEELKKEFSSLRSGVGEVEEALEEKPKSGTDQLKEQGKFAGGAIGTAAISEAIFGPFSGPAMAAGGMGLMLAHKFMKKDKKTEPDLEPVKPEPQKNSVDISSAVTKATRKPFIESKNQQQNQQNNAKDDGGFDLWHLLLTALGARNLLSDKTLGKGKALGSKALNAIKSKLGIGAAAKGAAAAGATGIASYGPPTYKIGGLIAENMAAKAGTAASGAGAAKGAVTAASSSLTSKIAAPLARVAPFAPFIGAAGLGAYTIYDEYKTNKDRLKAREDLGLVSAQEDLDFNSKLVGNSVGAGLGIAGGMLAGAKAGALIGGIVGGPASPLSALGGAIIGGAVGATAGSSAGQYLGQYIGEMIGSVSSLDKQRLEEDLAYLSKHYPEKYKEFIDLKEKEERKILDMNKLPPALLKNPKKREEYFERVSMEAARRVAPKFKNDFKNARQLSGPALKGQSIPLKPVKTDIGEKTKSQSESTVRNVTKTESFDFSEKTFMEKDPEGYKKYADRKEQLIAERTKGVTDPTQRKEIISGIETEVKQEFKDQASKVGASKDLDMSFNKNSEKQLLDFIAKKESGGDYNILVGGKKMPLTEMTVKDVMEFQKGMKGKGFESSAVGKYQIIASTLKENMKKAGVKDTDLFNEETQDKLGKALLDKRGYQDYLSGKITKEQFADNLSKEWAALPYKTGASFYDKVGSNKALVSRESLLAAIPSSDGTMQEPTIMASAEKPVQIKKEDQLPVLMASAPSSLGSSNIMPVGMNYEVKPSIATSPATNIVNPDLLPKRNPYLVDSSFSSKIPPRRGADMAIISAQNQSAKDETLLSAVAASSRPTIVSPTLNNINNSSATGASLTNFKGTVRVPSPYDRYQDKMSAFLA